VAGQQVNELEGIWMEAATYGIMPASAHRILVARSE
jgi:hypothetical protein